MAEKVLRGDKLKYAPLSQGKRKLAPFKMVNTCFKSFKKSEYVTKKFIIKKEKIKERTN
jgi:hypothetical protein